MSWATKYIEELQLGNTVQFRPRGNSMEGKISSGQLVTVEPLKFTLVTDDILGSVLETKVLDTLIEVDDIVLCKVKGKQYLHLVSAMRKGQYQISNNKGFVNGWITVDSIFGKCVKIEN